MNLTIRLPVDRRTPGELDLVHGGMVLLRAVPCLGKADNGRAIAAGNPTRNPIRPYGDTPLGLYEPAAVETFDPPHGRMGRLVIHLVGITGAAKAAMAQRQGLAIHAGRGDAELFATFGCVRLLDRDMAMLAAKLGGQPAAIEIAEILPGA